MNKVIKFLIFSDVALASGFGFINPIFAIFLTERIKGGNIEVVGYAAAIYWIVISLTVVPFGKYLDMNHGEKDDFWFIVIGNVLAALAVLGYIFSYLPWHIYLLQATFSLGMSMNISAYPAIFTRHIDKNKESFDWSTRAALIGIGTGTAGALGGIVANRFGFNTLFIGIIIFVLISALLPFFIYKKICSKDVKILRIPLGKNV
ncbi:MFS transporter [Patescibacteria group bacterium]|nr:MFS transporter [Patescibacteria group bacterium]MBU2472631.1 MFS transporter [Patescibacteria group bacterium]